MEAQTLNLKRVNCVIGPKFRFGPMAAMKTFYRGKGPNRRPVATLFQSDAADIFDRIPLVGRSVSQLKSRSEECRSVALPPLCVPFRAWHQFIHTLNVVVELRSFCKYSLQFCCAFQKINTFIFFP